MHEHIFNIIYCILYVRTIINQNCSNVHNLHESNMAQILPMLLGVHYSKLSQVLCNRQSTIVNAVSSGYYYCEINIFVGSKVRRIHLLCYFFSSKVKFNVKCEMSFDNH